MTHAFGSGKLIEQGIHIPAGNKEAQPWLAQTFEVLCAAPVRLCNDADTIAVLFQKAADNRRPEAWMINIGIPGNKNKIQCIPASFRHILLIDR